MKKPYWIIGALILCLALQHSTLWAQAQSPVDIALRHLQEKSDNWQLTDADFADVVVSDHYTSRHNGATHIYFNQRHAGIELYNAINGVHLNAAKEVVFSTNRFTPALAERVNTTVPSITPRQAIQAAAQQMNLDYSAELRLIDQVGDRQFTYSGGDLSRVNIPVELKYQLVEGGLVRLVWDLSIDTRQTPDYWSVRVDAVDGTLLDQHNWTVSCNFGTPEHQHGAGCHHAAHQSAHVLQSNNDGAQYNVWPVPAESPSHGEREIVVNPADPLYSPFGWHDTNGEEGPEYTITRGNNVHAYLDLDNDDTPAGDEPDGGDDLIFDFPIDLAQEPDTYQEAAVTQLFYMNNFLHDFGSAYGFDEPAGNFQQNNYGNGGNGGDYVLAQAQDGGGTNNANFATPPDGGNGRMQMYLWTGGGSIFTVNAPQPVAGAYTVQQAGFGGQITQVPTTGNVIVIDDGTGEGTLGCNPPTPENAEQLDGAVALIDRGSCEFGLKCLNAQEAGAIGVIVCNFEDEIITMGPGAVGGQVTIPAVMIGVTDCQLIRQFAGTGLNVTFQVPEDNGAEFIDGDLDNGIVAHELGHGISNRLTGGPSAAGCLGNGEQMGEGWSDYFALVTSVRPGDTGEMPRGIGTFALRQDNNGPGIRRQRYSTNMNLNTQTYVDIAGQGVHATGEIWAGVTWDLYWAMVELYGWSDDPINGDLGNNMAIQLVMDGMKLQACSPGFMDGRDAILAADELNYDGIHQCLIWDVFARRGIGFFSDQGSSGTNSDGSQDFESRPQCIAELKIDKKVTDFIEAGDEIEVTLTLTNHKGEGVTEVVVEDDLPAGLTFIPGSEEGATATVNGSLVTLEVGEIANDEVKVVTYRLASDESLLSIRQFIDDIETGGLDNFFIDVLDEGVFAWQVTEIDAFSGEKSWYVTNAEQENDQIVQLTEAVEVVGTRPVLRFYHKYNTQIGVDGGFVEISTDGGFSWDRINEKLIRNPYNSIMQYGTLAIPNLGSFSGQSDGWIPTYVDLSEYLGQSINIRWRFGSDVADTGTGDAPGWYIDDVELMDMFNYNNETCVMSAEGDLACAIAEQEGTIVQSGILNSTEDPTEEAGIAIFPNPASTLLNVALNTTARGQARLQLIGADGRTVLEQPVQLDGFAQMVPVNVSRLPAGIYYVRIQAGTKSFVEKVVIK